jgi:hypothetical protein
MIGYRKGRVVMDKIGPGFETTCPAAAEGIQYWGKATTNIGGINVGIPSGQLFHRVTGQPPYVLSETANFTTWVRPICNWRIDFVYQEAGHVTYERRAGNVNWTCSRFGELITFPRANKRFGRACAELYGNGVFVARQCHQVAVRSWS